MQIDSVWRNLVVLVAPRHHPPINIPNSSGDPIGVMGQQAGDRVRPIFGSTHPTKGMEPAEALQRTMDFIFWVRKKVALLRSRYRSYHLSTSR